MTSLHQSSQAQSTSWQVLDRQPRQMHLGGALRLQARQSGWLAIQRGRVWLTRDGGGDDHVLGRGDQIWLQAGEGLVVEPWQAGASAQLGWLLGAAVGAPVQVAALPRDGARFEAGWRGLAAALRAAFGRLPLAARSADAIARRAQGSIRAGDSIASCGAVQ